MRNINRAIPLYNFLRHCNMSKLEKVVLDCGAGGDCPPLSIFSENEYETFGIDISTEQIILFNKFCKDNDVNLSILEADMRAIPYENERFSFVYSYNTIFHMTKNDIKKAMIEMRRVLNNDGLCFVNFTSITDSRYGIGELLSKGEYLRVKAKTGEKIIQSFFEDDEADAFFEGFQLIHKEKRITYQLDTPNQYVLSYIDYIAKKE